MSCVKSCCSVAPFTQPDLLSTLTLLLFCPVCPCVPISNLSVMHLFAVLPHVCYIQVILAIGGQPALPPQLKAETDRRTQTTCSAPVKYFDLVPVHWIPTPDASCSPILHQFCLVFSSVYFISPNHNKNHLTLHSNVIPEQNCMENPTNCSWACTRQQ